MLFRPQAQQISFAAIVGNAGVRPVLYWTSYQSIDIYNTENAHCSEKHMYSVHALRDDKTPRSSGRWLIYLVNTGTALYATSVSLYKISTGSKDTQYTGRSGRLESFQCPGPSCDRPSHRDALREPFHNATVPLLFLQSPPNEHLRPRTTLAPHRRCWNERKVGLRRIDIRESFIEHIHATAIHMNSA